MISINDFLSLPKKNRIHLLKQLQQAHKAQINNKIAKEKPDICCPFCKSKKFYHNGSDLSGKARFLCRKCRRTFSERTGTPMHAIKYNEKFIIYFNLMSKGYKTLHAMAEDIGISVTTAFQWRHKILSAMNESMKKFEGITDFDSGVVPFSRKGLKKNVTSSKDSGVNANILAIADYSSNSELKLLSIGTLRPVDFSDDINEKLKGNAIVIAPWKKTTVDFSKSRKLGFTFFNPEKHYNRFDVRQADKLHKELDTYTRKNMRGVSTKYLQQYSLWVDRLAGTKKGKNDDWAFLLKNQFAWGRYVNREMLFCRFMEGRSDADYIRASDRNWKTAEKFLYS